MPFSTWLGYETDFQKSKLLMDVAVFRKEKEETNQKIEKHKGGNSVLC